MTNYKDMLGEFLGYSAAVTAALRWRSPHLKSSVPCTMLDRLPKIEEDTVEELHECIKRISTQLEASDEK